jgi:diguanylate cyclase
VGGFEIDSLLTSSALARAGLALLFAVIGLKLVNGQHYLYWAGSLGFACLGFGFEALAFKSPAADLGMDLLTDLAVGSSLVLLAGGLYAFHGQRFPRWMLALALLPAVGHAAAVFSGGTRAETLRILLLLMTVPLSVAFVHVVRAMRLDFLYAHVLLAGALAMQIAVWTAPALLRLIGLRRDVIDLTLLMDGALFALLNISLFALDAERSHRKLARLATTDVLTGLCNRRGILDTLGEGTASAAILIADIDKFKHINDRWGHGAGDLVLQEFARRLQAVFRRASDVTGRWGGEEFVVVALGMPLETALERAEVLRMAIAEEPFEIGSQTIDVTVSIGVAEMIDGTAASVRQHLERADGALYAAKEEGRNRVKLAA